MYLRLQDKEEYHPHVPHSALITPGGSLYIPEGGDTCTSCEVTFKDLHSAQRDQNKPVDALNEYLDSRDASPFGSRLNTLWEIASERTRRYYIRKAGQGVTAITEDIAPNSPAQLFQATCSLQAIQRTLSSDEETETTVDETMLEALADCYHAAGSWETVPQILSIMADRSCNVGYLTCHASFHCANRSLYLIHHKCSRYTRPALQGKNNNVVIKSNHKSSQRDKDDGPRKNSKAVPRLLR